mmetsp:Transcript_9757/g.15986  ORF Transcript_9757/g.15986 Transcript_9757/m.15986 type:complete len:226 (-) Transcript_9757:1785-2462(-)
MSWRGKGDGPLLQGLLAASDRSLPADRAQLGTQTAEGARGKAWMRFGKAWLQGEEQTGRSPGTGAHMCSGLEGVCCTCHSCRLGGPERVGTGTWEAGRVEGLGSAPEALIGMSGAGAWTGRMAVGAGTGMTGVGACSGMPLLVVKAGTPAHRIAPVVRIGPAAAHIVPVVRIEVVDCIVPVDRIVVVDRPFFEGRHPTQQRRRPQRQPGHGDRSREAHRGTAAFA